MGKSNAVQQDLSSDRSVGNAAMDVSSVDWQQRIVERVRPQLTSYFPELNGQDSSIACVPIGGDYAKTFRLDICTNELRKVIFFKQCPIFERLNPGILEFDTLQVLYQRLPELTRLCAVARPLEYFSDWNAYAMESVAGENFKDHLLRLNSRLSSASAVTQLRASVSKCGEWLKAFHTTTQSSQSRPFVTTEYVASIQEEVDLSSLKALRFSPPMLTELDTVLALLPRLDGCLMPCAKWHWDYTPAHVFLDGDRVSVIDITGLDNVPVYEDVGHFLSALVTVNNLPWFPLYDRSRADGLLCDTFLHIYCGEQVNDSAMLFANVYKLKSLLLWFHAQYCHASRVLPRYVSKALADYHLTRVFEPPLLSTIKKIRAGVMAIPASREGCAISTCF